MPSVLHQNHLYIIYCSPRTLLLLSSIHHLRVLHDLGEGGRHERIPSLRPKPHFYYLGKVTGPSAADSTRSLAPRRTSSSPARADTPTLSIPEAAEVAAPWTSSTGATCPRGTLASSRKITTIRWPLPPLPARPFPPPPAVPPRVFVLTPFPPVPLLLPRPATEDNLSGLGWLPLLAFTVAQLSLPDPSHHSAASASFREFECAAGIGIGAVAIMLGLVLA